jgi:hypothetical protein
LKLLTPRVNWLSLWWILVVTFTTSSAHKEYLIFSFPYAKSYSLPFGMCGITGMIEYSIINIWRSLLHF